MYRYMLAFFLLFSTGILAQNRRIGIKEAVSICAMSPVDAKKALEKSGFSYLEDVPSVLGYKNGGYMSFIEMNTGRIIELDLDGSRGKIFNLLLAYNGEMLNSIISLEILAMDFKEGSVNVKESWEKEIREDALKDMNFEDYTKTLDDDNKIWMFRASLSNDAGDDQNRKYIVRLHYEPAKNNSSISDSVAIKARDQLKRIDEAAAFLKQNKTRKGVTITGSGLQFSILKSSKGIKPTLEDTVVMVFRGYLLNEYIFASGRTGKMSLNGLIPGLKEGLSYMNTGSKYKFYVPSQLGYGSSDITGIPPGSLTIYEVELVSVKKSQTRKVPAYSSLPAGN